jgi:Protein of unknown function (DUF3307)
VCYRSENKYNHTHRQTSMDPSLDLQMPSVIPSQDIALVLFLLVLFNVKHFLADYLFNNDYMLRKSNATEWFTPLISHCGVHSALTWVVTFPLAGLWAFVLAALDMLIHFVVDYWKAQILRYPLNSRPFWIAFGADQLLHSLTYIALAYITVKLI